MSDVVWLDDQLWFPEPSRAVEEPDGLLAVGGDLSPERLLLAYANGIFPWYEDGQPILWWSPSQRSLIDPDHLHISRTMRKVLRKQDYEVRTDTNFNGVIKACAAPRAYTSGTWITEEMIEAYTLLHELGFAHSIEVIRNDRLIGGLYGVSLGGCFFGESMFSLEANASKIAFIHLVRGLFEAGFRVIDCQLQNSHLESLGAYSMPRNEFLAILGREIKNRSLQAWWKQARSLRFEW